ncbi:MAG TPA: hypothetical protein PKC09_08095 [Paracoccus sp. (in: a-proteobacteria)]|nr:hypothetical protein [Paracoccus sp. (in: a-proteobacteria)]HMR35413.1 hypothetical protein [Paracoccus sp. (in: a-proteobacteria)]
MTEAMKSVLSAENASIRELVADALGVVVICVSTVAILWIPAILSA